jgi:hypothetical protein
VLVGENKRAVRSPCGPYFVVAPLSAKRTFTRRGVKPSESEFANACLVEAEVVTNLVTHRLNDMQPEALGIVPEVAHQRVTKDQDLVWKAAAPEERHATQLGADVHAVRVVLGTAVGNDDRYVLQRTLELDRQLVERRTNEFLKFLLAVMPVFAHGFVIAPSVAHPPRSRAQRIAALLASPRTANVTGANWVIDGGMVKTT